MRHTRIIKHFGIYLVDALAKHSTIFVNLRFFLKTNKHAHNSFDSGECVMIVFIQNVCFYKFVIADGRRSFIESVDIVRGGKRIANIRLS